MERFYFWILNDGAQPKARGRVFRYVVSDRESGIIIDEVVNLQGTVWVSALGEPTEQQPCTVHYELEGDPEEGRWSRPGTYQGRVVRIGTFVVTEKMFKRDQ